MATTIMTYRYVYRNPHTGVRWFDGQSSHSVLLSKELGRGPLGTVEAVIAHHRDVHAALQRAASAFYMRAASNMAAHRDTGAARVGMEKGDLDWSIYLEDADAGTSSPNRTRKRSALSIEYGHRISGDTTGRRVGGLFILTGAANSMARKPDKRW